METNWSEDANREKERGNKFFKDKRFEEAITCYTNAITFDDTNEILYGNRAQCYLSLKKFFQAESDCDQALKINSQFVKGYFRRALARKGLHKYNEAKNDLIKALQLDKDNKQIENELNKIKQFFNSTETINLTYSLPEKPYNFLSKNPLIEVKIGIDTQKSNKLQVFNIDRLPITSFEFYRDWRQLIELNDVNEQLNYLEKIGVTKFKEIFLNSIEPNVFSQILNTLALNESASNEFVFNLLIAFTTINRFGSLILFLDKNDKQNLRKIIGAQQDERKEFITRKYFA